MNQKTMKLIFNLIQSSGDIASRYKQFLFCDVEDKEIITQEIIIKINIGFSSLIGICDQLEIDKTFLSQLISRKF